MKKATEKGAARQRGKSAASTEMRRDYDFSKGVRGKHAKSLVLGGRLVTLEADVAAVFHDSESVNRALRVLIETNMHSTLTET
jgi:hypothetical protein